MYIYLPKGFANNEPSSIYPLTAHQREAVLCAVWWLRNRGQPVPVCKTLPGPSERALDKGFLIRSPRPWIGPKGGEYRAFLPTAKGVRFAVDYENRKVL